MTNALRRKEGQPAGVYVHLPFCRRRCPYCDYPVVVGDGGRARYAGALRRELAQRAENFAGRDIESIYFGGGTPSFAPVEWIGDVVEAVEAKWGRRSREVTLEANPEDVDDESLAAWRDAGVNRVVLGVQSFDDDRLGALGRVHDAGSADRALRAAVDRGDLAVGVDLLFATPDQGLEGWRSELARLSDFEGIDELFALEYVRAGEASGRADESEGASRRERMFEAAKEAATELGMVRTGIASFAVDGRGGRQMELYWNGGEYLGLGLAASSFRILGAPAAEGVAIRRRNSTEIRTYVAEPGAEAEQWGSTAEECFADRLALGMRTRRGIAWSEVECQFGPALSDASLTRGREVLEWCMEREFAFERDGRVRPTERGLDVADGLDRAIRRRLSGGTEAGGRRIGGADASTSSG